MMAKYLERRVKYRGNSLGLIVDYGALSAKHGALVSFPIQHTVEGQ